MTTLSDEAVERLRQAILKCQQEGIYPSAKQIKRRMEMAKSPTGAAKVRKDHTLSGAECQARNKIFQELGLTVKKTG